MTTATATTTPQIRDLIGLMRTNSRAARAARFLLKFFDVVCQMTIVRLYNCILVSAPHLLCNPNPIFLLLKF